MNGIVFPTNANEWPEVTQISHGENQVELQLVVSANITWFKGHFPGNPVLPGVVQIKWAQFFAATLAGLQVTHRLRNLKFNQMLLPESVVVLSLTIQPEKQRVKFQYHQQASLVSSGVFEGSLT